MIFYDLFLAADDLHVTFQITNFLFSTHHHGNPTCKGIDFSIVSLGTSFHRFDTCNEHSIQWFFWKKLELDRFSVNHSGRNTGKSESWLLKYEGHVPQSCLFITFLPACGN